MKQSWKKWILGVVVMLFLCIVFFQKELVNLFNYESGDFNELTSLNEYTIKEVYGWHEDSSPPYSIHEYSLSEEEYLQLFAELNKLNLKSVIVAKTFAHDFTKSYKITTTEFKTFLLSFYEDNVLGWDNIDSNPHQGERYYYYE